MKDKMWFFSLIAGILGFASILAPAWGVIVPSYSFFVWFWGLEVSTDMGIRFLQDELLTYGIISTIMIIIGAVLLVYTSILYKRESKRIKFSWIIAGLLIILASVFYVVGLEIAYPGLLADENHSTALIGPLISGILAITSELIFLRLDRK
jgi:hypothetical protein